MSVNTRIANLRNEMKNNGIDAYIVPTSDFHQTEYVGEHFKSRAYISGFSGSAGTAVITADKALLWTDGRYFIQAAKELASSEVELCKMGNEGVPTIIEFLADTLAEGSTLGFDGRTMSVTEGQSYEGVMAGKKGSINYNVDLVGNVWADRPELSTEPAFHLQEKYTGEVVSSKLARIREKMKSYGATKHIITTLDDVCWIFNFRGNDVKCNPLVLSYTIIGMDSVELFINEDKLTDEIKADLNGLNITFRPYDAVYQAIADLKDASLLLEPGKANYTLFKNIANSVAVINGSAPSSLMKAMKNEVELENIRQAHIKDGVAVTKFMYWLKHNIGKIEITEISAAQKLEDFRAENESFMGPSFSPISAYAGNAAQCHYSATEESNLVVEARGLYLSDSGGNYSEGSTDITRTFAVGPLTDEEAHHFTTVCRAMLRLSAAKFNYGICGFNLDALARGIMWNENMDYNHGTGHGVGYLTSIHEGPANIRWNIAQCPAVPIEEGMVFSNEPGAYVEDSHGIRTENLVIVKKGEKNAFGQFMHFETLAFAPIDLDAMKPELMTAEEKSQLNAYHVEVFEKIAPHLSADEQEWLKEYTRAI